MKKIDTLKKVVCTLQAILITAALSGCGEVQTGSGNSTASTKEETTTAVSVQEESREDEVSSATQTEDQAASSEEEVSSQTEQSSDAESLQAAEESAVDETYDFTGMAGYWYIDGDYNTAYIHITKDGTFTSYYASGSEEYSGRIVHELDPYINNYIFAFYPDDGSPHLFFTDDGETEKNDLYTGGDYPVHYVKLYGEGGLGDDGRDPNETDVTAEGNEFLGQWNCERANIEIFKTDMPVPEKDKYFYVTITWSSSVSTYVEWSYVGEYSDGKLVCDNNGAKTYVEYQDPETPPTRTIEYTNGSAEFEIRDGYLIWNDLEEDSASEMKFTKVDQ